MEQKHGGWSRKKRLAFERAFYDYLGECEINSKDSGQINLGEYLYDAQKIFFTSVFDGLEQDIHSFDALKSRQLGMSTGTRALSVFWMGMHDGLNGACVFDTDANKNNARREIEMMISGLPGSIEFPGIKTNNRLGISLDNGSSILFMSAGIKQNKSSGVLGRSVGLSMAHCSELCSWENPEGYEAFENSLSDINPNRLYIKESTARGYNTWHTIWTKDRANPSHVKCIFLGWWSKNTQQISKTHPDFLKYGVEPPTDKESKMIAEVHTRYGHQITEQQLAWYRRKMDPAGIGDLEIISEDHGATFRLQEQPSTEEEAWQMTGSIFFNQEKLTEQANTNASKKYSSYMFSTGIEFTDMRTYPAANPRSIELKVWEEPDPESVYVVSADVAYGLSDKNDRSSIQVLRCYADCVEQVAEYAHPLIGTRPFAWVTLALAGWYAGESADVYLIVEQNGPGVAVWDEIDHLKTHLPFGYQPPEVTSGLANVLRNVRTYVSIRQDSLSGSKRWNWTTSHGTGQNSKIRLMERCRDFTENGMLRIRSLSALEEMRSITREGESIGAAGSKKDDRVMSLALGVRCWEDRVRRMMSARNRTRDNELAKRRQTIQDLAKLYNQNQFQSFLAVKGVERRTQARSLSRHGWRYRERF